MNPQTIRGDVFVVAQQHHGVAVIGTNTATNSRGHAVMGRGAARQAAGLYPELPVQFGAWLQQFPVSANEQRGTLHYRAVDAQQYVFRTPEHYRILAFMVKYGWWQDADLEVISQQAAILNRRCQQHPAVSFFLTRVGSGNGHLAWSDVKPVLFPVLTADNIALVEPND